MAPKGGGMSDVSLPTPPHLLPLSGISELSFDFTILSHVLFFCLVLLLFPLFFFFFSVCWPILLTFFFSLSENASIIFR